MSQSTETYTRVPLFEGLGSEQIAKLLAIAEDVTATVGESIVTEGQPGDGFYIIAAGEFEVRKDKEGGDPTTLNRLGEQSFFGELSLVSDEPRTASVVCVVDGRLKKIPATSFRELLDADELVAYKAVLNMTRVMAQRLIKLQDRFIG